MTEVDIAEHERIEAIKAEKVSDRQKKYIKQYLSRLSPKQKANIEKLIDRGNGVAITVRTINTAPFTFTISRKDGALVGTLDK